MDTLFYNGCILTMEEELYAECMLVRDGIIIAYGKFNDIYKLAVNNTLLVDLKGNTIMSSRVDYDLNSDNFLNSPADLIVLDRNPMECNINEIKGLKILEIIEKGVTTYKRNI